jgi:hypothetical protein
VTALEIVSPEGFIVMGGGQITGPVSGPDVESCQGGALFRQHPYHSLAFSGRLMK